MGENAFDILILGAGPAGVSAALTAKNRGRSVGVLSSRPATTPLWKAHRIDNYPGMTGMTGKELLSAMTDSLTAQNIPLIEGRATGVMAFGKQSLAHRPQPIHFS